MDEIEKRIYGSCEGCLRFLKVNSFSFSSGSRKSLIVFVGSSLEKEEAIYNDLFLDRSLSGRGLRVYLESLRLKRSQVFCLNVFPCYSESSPIFDDKKFCQPRLIENLDWVPNKRVVFLLGNLSYQTVLNVKNSVSDDMGKLILKRNGVLYLPSYHPVSVMRSREARDCTINFLFKLRPVLRSWLESRFTEKLPDKI